MIESPLLPQFSGYINGRWTPARLGLTLPVYNPATGELLAEVADMGEEETQAAIVAAREALRTQTTTEERQRWLISVADLLLEEQEGLSRIITLEQGKPLRESRAEVGYAATFFRFFAGQLALLSPKELERRIRGCSWTIYHRPAGVAAVITPWNFPLAMMAKKISAALAADCSVIAKPSELTPLSAIALCHLIERAGIPAGKWNLIIGQPIPIGKILCQHPSIRVISFTGSTATGKLLLRESSEHIKRLTLELGGNAPLLVFEDADLELAVEELMANKFRCAGQTCVCVNRVYVHSDVLALFAEALAASVTKLRLGNGMNADTDIGPLIHRAAFDKVSLHVSEAMYHGAQRVVGHDPERPQHNYGCFYPPTVLVGANHTMKVFQEETFGPVIAVASFHSEEEALCLANETPYGLAAYAFTSDSERAQRCSRRLQFAHVGLNTGTGPTPEAPFGGMKQSGMGREGGAEGLAEFWETQTVVKA